MAPQHKTLGTSPLQFVAFSLATFLFYCALTALIFAHRLPLLSTHYTMPDVDTDSGLWYQWFITHIIEKNELYDVIAYEGFPYGYDISFAPSENLIYSIHSGLLLYFGNSWQNILLINNISSLLVYPLSGLSAFFLSFYITRRFWPSALAGVIFGFSYYLIFMGRGMMSINHVELIPIYFLCLFSFIKKPKLWRAVLSGLIWGLLFMSDAYYAFWAGLFTPVFLLLLLKGTLLERGKTSLFYFSVTIPILACINAGFIHSQYRIMTNTSLLAQTGRNQSPMNELGTVLNEVSLPLAEWSLLSSKINKFIPHILAVWPLAVISYGLIKVRKYSALVLSLVICFLLSLILSSFVPGFFWVNEVYFRFFGMFRSVGRLSHFTNLFLSLTVAVLLMEKTSTADKKVIVGIICAGLLAVAISITNHPTLRETTNFSVIASLYDEISAATPIQAIATYPLSLSDGSQGFPSTYQLISQIVHKKPFSSGVSQLDHGEARIYQDEIRYSVNPEAISTLQEHGIDTIFVYNNLVDNQQIVNELLQADSRLTFIGRFSREPDVVSRSANDLSRDISVYSFVDPVPNPFSSSNVNSTEKIESYMYKATINDVNQPLLLPLPYSSRWMAYSSPASTNIFHFLFAKDAIPSVKDGFSNSWKASQLCTNVPCEVVLLFEPYAMKITLRWLSWFTIVISVYITAVGLLKERYP